MSKKQPLVSIVMRTDASAPTLGEAIEAVLAQSYDQLELICVVDAADREAMASVSTYAQSDARVRVVEPAGPGVAAARNAGLASAQGMWVMVLESDELLCPEALSTMLDALDAQADMACDLMIAGYEQGGADGNPQVMSGLRRGVKLGGAQVFSRRDIPATIMIAADARPGNKLYLRSFLAEHGLQFCEQALVEDRAFSALAFAQAERILHQDGVVLRRTTAGNAQSFAAISAAVMSAVPSVFDQLEGFACRQSLEPALRRWAIDCYLDALSCVEDWSDSAVEELYTAAHELFSQSSWRAVSVGLFRDDPYVYPRFDAVRMHDYAAMRTLAERRLVVSLTSYPARIPYVPQSIASLLSQSRPADQIVLWLSRDEFEGGLDTLPEELRALVASGSLTVRWCEDNLKSHKKYLYALQEFADDVVVCVDDDLLYDHQLLERLWSSYLQHPEAISAARTHLMLVDEGGGNFLPYAQWPPEVGSVPFVPSMRLLCTSGAGSLYPPHIMPQNTFDVEAIKATCLNADDLWLKAMQVVAQVPVVAAVTNQRITSIKDAQATSLYEANSSGGNDVQLAQISAYLDKTYWEGILVQGVAWAGGGSMEDACGLMAAYRTLTLQKWASDRRISELLLRIRKMMLHYEAQLVYVRRDVAREHQAFEDVAHELDDVRGSLSFKAGRALTAAPRGARAVIKKLAP